MVKTVNLAGQLSSWKSLGNGRFSLTKDDLGAHEAMFQLAFMEAKEYALLEEVEKLWETTKLKHMTEEAEFFKFFDSDM